MDPINVVWESTVDQGKFLVKVTQPNDVVVHKGEGDTVTFDDRDTIGTLTVTVVETGEELMTASVQISHGAIFGPDTYDVDYWQHLALTVIDDWLAAHGEPIPDGTSQ